MMITKLRDKWFEENGYWYYTRDRSSRAGNYVSHNNKKMTDLLNDLVCDDNTVEKQKNKTITIRIITPEMVINYLNERLTDK